MKLWINKYGSYDLISRIRVYPVISPSEKNANSFPLSLNSTLATSFPFSSPFEIRIFRSFNSSPLAEIYTSRRRRRRRRRRNSGEAMHTRYTYISEISALSGAQIYRILVYTSAVGGRERKDIFTRSLRDMRTNTGNISYWQSTGSHSPV